ncbi:MAG: hypothetical protein Q7S60_01570 [bacterium]|nr:hypothetical protein [bacterium]
MIAKPQKASGVDKIIVRKFLKRNPLLHPEELKDIFPAYGEFAKIDSRRLLWAKPDTKKRLAELRGKCKKVIVVVSGVAAGGKDTIRQQFEEAYPGLVIKPVTATTRKMRPGEKDSRDYHFYESRESFLSAVRKGELVEYVDQYGDFYGLPKKSVAEAITSSAPIIFAIFEPTGWGPFRRFIAKSYEDNLSLFFFFVLPQLSYKNYVEKWLPRHRIDYQERAKMAIWRLQVAAKEADVLVINPIVENEKPGKQAYEATRDLLLSLLHPTLLK